MELSYLPNLTVFLSISPHYRSSWKNKATLRILLVSNTVVPQLVLTALLSGVCCQKWEAFHFHELFASLYPLKFCSPINELQLFWCEHYLQTRYVIKVRPIHWLFSHYKRGQCIGLGKRYLYFTFTIKLTRSELQTVEICLCFTDSFCLFLRKQCLLTCR